MTIYKYQFLLFLFIFIIKYMYLLSKLTEVWFKKNTSKQKTEEIFLLLNIFDDNRLKTGIVQTNITKKLCTYISLFHISRNQKYKGI